MSAIPSIPNTDRLPLSFKGKQWYLRKRLRDGRRIERGLGTANKDEALRRARLIVHEALNLEHLTSWRAKVAKGMAIKGWLWMMNSNASYRTQKKGGKIDLSILEFIAVRSGGLCEVSGIPFYLGDEKRHPFQPSLDRIDSSIGYEAWNMRMVCYAVNLCMSHWGEKIFLQISAAMMVRHLAKIAVGGDDGGGGFPLRKIEQAAVTN